MTVLGFLVVEARLVWGFDVATTLAFRPCSGVSIALHLYSVSLWHGIHFIRPDFAVFVLFSCLLLAANFGFARRQRVWAVFIGRAALERVFLAKS